MKISSFTSSGNAYYNIFQAGGSIFNTGYSGLTTYPCIYASNTNSYMYLFSKAPIGYNLKTLSIEVRTRNDGTNNGPCYIGLATNPGTSPTWVTGKYTNWIGATSSSWTTYKTTISIPEGTDTSNYYFGVYLGHSGSAYTMWMDFQNLLGYY